MIPLTVRSSYSLMWGTSYVKQVCLTAKRLGYDRLALTDTDNLYGLWPFFAGCEAEGIEPIVGAELTDPGTGERAVALVESAAGYRNLCRLITRRRYAEKTPFDLQTAIAEQPEGLVVLTGSSGLLEAGHTAGAAVAAASRRGASGSDLRTGQHCAWASGGRSHRPRSRSVRGEPRAPTEL